MEQTPSTPGPLTSFFQWIRAFGRANKTPIVEVLDRAVAIKSEISSAGVSAFEVAKESSALMASVGELGIGMAKGAPVVVVAGAACPPLGLAALVAVFGVSFFKIHQIFSAKKKDEQRDAILEALVQDFAAWKEGFKHEAERLGIKAEWTGTPADMATLLEEVLSQRDKEADSRAVQYLSVLQQSNADMRIWFHDFLQDQFQQTNSLIAHHSKEIRSDLESLSREINKAHEAVMSLHDRRLSIAHFERWTDRFIVERRSRIYGRDSWIKDHFCWIHEGKVPMDRGQAIIAVAGAGKTSVMAELCGRAVESGRWIVARHFFRSDYARGASVDAAFTSLITQLRRSIRDIPREHAFHVSSTSVLDGLQNELAETADTAAQSKPVLIFLDGLDECDEQKGFLSVWTDALRELRSDVVVLTGIRADDEASKPSWSHVWSPHLPLPPLDRDGIQEWLNAAGEGRLSRHTDEWAGQVFEASDGLPLLAQYLIEDLCSMEAPNITRLTEFGRGLEAYVEGQVEALAQDPSAREFLDVLALLCLVRQPLECHEIEGVLALGSFQRTALGAPQSVTRWWNRIAQGTRFSFTHARLGRAFARCPQIGVGEVEVKLLRWVQEVETGYSFDWGVGHLLEVFKRDPLAGAPLLAKARERLTDLAYVKEKYRKDQDGRLLSDLRRLNELEVGQDI